MSKSSALDTLFRKNRKHRDNKKHLTPKLLAKREQRIAVEALEPRLLLSAETMVFVAGATAADLTIRIDDAATPVVQIVDNHTGNIVMSRALAETSGVAITGSDQNDSLKIDSSAASAIPIAFDGGGGTDKLIGPEVDATWHVTGRDAGTVANVTFTHVEQLQGAADNQDTFVFEEGGSIAGFIDGGPGGFDSLVVAGGKYSKVSYDPTGPQAGTVSLDENVIRYDGLEPITVDADAPNMVLSLTNDADQAIIETIIGGELRLRTLNGTFETMTFNMPTGTNPSLTINLGGGDDVLTIATHFSVINNSDTLPFTFTINGGPGNDDITFAPSASGDGYVLDGGDDTDILRASGDHMSLKPATGSGGPPILTTTQVVGTRVVTALTDNGHFEAAVLSGIDLVHSDWFAALDFIADVPTFTPQGPGPIINAGSNIPSASSPVTGAVPAVAVDPRDPRSLFVATVDGGVWKNNDRTVYFGNDDSTLDPQDTAVIDEVAALLIAHPELSVTVNGYTDSKGTTQHNKDLSDARAKAVKDYLVNTRHIESLRVSVQGFGESDPIVPNDKTDPDNVATPLNRRVELIVNQWTPLTDQFPSLAFASIAISPRDAMTIRSAPQRRQISSSFMPAPEALAALAHSGIRKITALD